MNGKTVSADRARLEEAGTEAEAEAFSWLIGAAPELAAALRGLLSVLEHGIEHGDDFDAAVQEGYRALALATEPPEVPD